LLPDRFEPPHPSAILNKYAGSKPLETTFFQKTQNETNSHEAGFEPWSNLGCEPGFKSSFVPIVFQPAFSEKEVVSSGFRTWIQCSGQIVFVYVCGWVRRFKFVRQQSLKKFSKIKINCTDLDLNQDDRYAVSELVWPLLHNDASTPFQNYPTRLC